LSDESAENGDFFVRVLLSNDDGVMASGIRSLFKELTLSYDTTIIAPLEERSTTGHSLSLDKPLRLELLENNIYGCSGFPGDCVLMGLGHLMKNNRPDVVVSGINRGANLGQDLYYSGTVAAAREAAFHGVPSIAVSLVFNAVNEPHLYDECATFINRCLNMNIHRSIPSYTLININFPNLPMNQIKGVKLTEIGFRKYSEEIYARKDTRDREYFWIAGHYEGFIENPNTDCYAVMDGYIALTPHSLIHESPRDYQQIKNCVDKLNAQYFS
jgi:5'-nucleotidase